MAVVQAKLVQDRVDAKEKELIRLIHAKSEKMAEKFANQQQHKSLSHCSDMERAWRINIPREILIDNFIRQLTKL